jgi:surface antigen
LCVIGGGAKLFANPSGWLSGLLADAAAITSSMRKSLATEAGPSHVEQIPQAPVVQPLASSDVTQAPGASAGTPAAPAPPIATAPSVSATDTDGTDSTAAAEGSSQSVPPVAAPAAHLEGYQKQAEAVGLHPDISGAVLSRLTKADYRNAGIAIKTALAETPDTEVLAWPRPAKPGLALFEVHFVPGAEQNCRRYVVTVTKDRWSTTAPAMEKCGIKPIAQRAAKASVE